MASPLPRSLKIKKPDVSNTKLSLCLAGMVIAAGLCSIFIFLPLSLRLDEAQSLYQSNRSLGGMLKLVAEDVHVPLYHILLHGWLQVFSNTITAARLMSLMFFGLTILATYRLGSYAYGSRRIGLFAALLVTISPFMQWYGNEARMYAMLAFITVTNQYYFLRTVRENKRSSWLIYTVTAVAGAYTHYFFAFVLATHAAFYLLQRKRMLEPGKVFRRLVTTGVIVAAALSPWLIHAYRLGSASNTKPNLTTPTSVDLFNTYSQFLFGFQSDRLNTILVSLWPLIVLLTFFALQKRKKITPDTIFFMLAATFPVLGAFITSFVAQPFYLSRYLIVSLPILFILIAWIFSIYPKKLRRPLQLGLIAIIALTFIIQAVSPNTPVKEDYLAVTSYLSKNTRADDIVIVSAPFTIYPVEYYYRGAARLTTLPYWDRFREGAIPAFDQAKLPEEVKTANGVYQQAWLVLSFDQGYQQNIKDYYDKNFQRVVSKQFSPGLTLYSYRLRYDQGLAF